MPERYKQLLDDGIRTDYLGFLCQVEKRLFSEFGDDRYRNINYFYLFLNMLIAEIRSEPITLEAMIEFMDTPTSRSTKMRLIDQAKRDGYIVSIRKTDLEEPETLDDTSAKKAFFLSEELSLSLRKRLDGLITENMKFVDFTVSSVPA